MSVDYSQLIPGQEISSRTFVMDGDAVARYKEAVGDTNLVRSADGRQELSPAMAVAALSLGGVINDLKIPGGTVHAGQELDFTNAVAVGETLACSASLAQNSVRGEWRFLVVNLKVNNSEGHSVMSGKSTIMLPV